MVLYSAIARELANAGMSADDIVAALERIEKKHADARLEEEAAVLATKRERARVKKQQQRAASKSVPDVPFVPRDSGDKPPLKERSPEPPKENTPPVSASGANAPSAAPPDEWGTDRERLFGGALEWLKRKTNRNDRACRSQIGRWLKLAGNDATAILEVIRRARDGDVGEPVAWIEAALKAKPMNGHGHIDPRKMTDEDWRERATFYVESGIWPPWWPQPLEVPERLRPLFGDRDPFLFDDGRRRSSAA